MSPDPNGLEEIKGVRDAAEHGFDYKTNANSELAQAIHDIGISVDQSSCVFTESGVLMGKLDLNQVYKLVLEAKGAHTWKSKF